MNIQTVADNLRNTIAGKQQMLEQYRDARFKATGTEDVALFVSIEFLRDNIAELKRILQDVTQCARQASDDSWITSPDRMGGGGWTADELDPNRGWK